MTRRSKRLTAVAGLAGVALLVAGLAVVQPWNPASKCPPVANHPEWTVARRWDEATTRRDPARAARPDGPRPQPVPHLRRDVGRLGGLRPDRQRVHRQGEARRPSNVAAARNEAISYAAYRVLSSRYIKAVGGDESLSEFDDDDGLAVLSARR